jgi:hypothetical protein
VFQVLEWPLYDPHSCTGPAWRPGPDPYAKYLVAEARKNMPQLTQTGTSSGACPDCSRETFFGIVHDCSGPATPPLAHLAADAAIDRAKVAAALRELGVDVDKLAKEQDQ